MTRPLFPRKCSGEAFAPVLNELSDAVTGVPDSVTKAVLPHLDHYHAAPGEEHALGLAFGVRAGGKRPVVLMQNSGLGRSLDALLGLQQLYGAGCVLVVVNRGELEWEEPQHQDWGDLTAPLLNLLPFPQIDFGETGLDGLRRCFELAFGPEEQTVILVVHRGNIDETA